MKSTQTGVPDRGRANAMRPIVWPDCDANLVLAQKTRRAVRDALISTEEQRKLQRRNLGFAILGFVCLLVLLGPAVWNGLEELIGEEPLFDVPTQVALLIVMLILAMLAALIAVWMRQRSVEHDRGGSEPFRPIEK